MKEHGGKYVLYNPDDKKSYILDPQDKAAPHAGHEVTVAGKVDGDTIHVEIEVSEIKATSKDPSRALVRTTNTVKNQKDETVLVYTPLRMLQGR